MGSFNCCYRLKGFHSILRLPILSKSAFRYEKSRDECLLMAYLARHTSIPLPKLLAAGTCDMGPYMVLSFVDGARLSDFLKDPSTEDAPITLQPNIDDALLYRAYRNMASLMLQLSKCRFSHIGALGQDELGNWLVTKRPVTLNMNQLVSCANYPPSRLPPKERTFASANEYFTALAEMHINHLQTQRNDAIEDAEDCRKKYVARHLFLKIARTFSKEHNDGPFPLYCDDLRPTNVIVNPDLDVCGVIDWEYCYAAPAEFTYCPPWWLLLTHPDDWTDGDLGSFLEQYLPLCRLMAESLENGHFWFCLAATSSFGDFTTLEDRVRLLAQPEQDELASFVEHKMLQAEDSQLDEHVSPHEMFTA
ncbi:uncharacterized protein F5Z01DRAFT_681155 [Emericellopsis atlantica]|uniref:Aminoglycoside phosphotransferase domain-containing protein n=1 Tax=Emericellopsis atlantica TaxID=2614577 RepID=A0A9P7ZNS0_9HYPO|nr:uncharacterized protein F5Z01DRAFT_681155 [Emericellopsis atlantica]KAG9255097.1 hypothetical protein F5Z01DRAFT_681155 [Emericellopsis atlantica]